MSWNIFNRKQSTKPFATGWQVPTGAGRAGKQGNASHAEGADASKPAGPVTRHYPDETVLMTPPIQHGVETKPASTLTEIVFVIDESGSMHGLEDDTIGGVNALIERNRSADGRANLSTVFFNTKTRVLHDRADIATVNLLGGGDYRPGGCTALLDAVGGAIDHVDMVQRYMPAGHKADHVLFAIATDGLENASHKYTYKQVKRMIEQHREQGWEFVFLGANIDVAQAADDLGIAPDRAMSYCADREGTAAVYDSFAEASLNMRASGSVNPDWAAPVARDNARRKGR